MNLRPYRALTLANFRQHLRNPLAVSSVLLASLLIVVALRFVDYSKAAHIKVRVVNQAHTALARDLLRSIRGVAYFDVTESTEPQASIAVTNGSADLAVVIPASTVSDRALSHSARLEVIRGQGAAADQGLLFLQLALDRTQQGLQRTFGLDRSGLPSVTIHTRAAQTKGLGILDAFLPGLLAMNIIQSGLLLAAGTIATYRSTGVLRRIQATGIDAGSFVLAHATSTFLLGVAQAGVLLGVAIALFSVKINILALVAMIALGYLVFLALGFAISGWITDAQRAPAIAASIGVPMMFVAFFPSDTLPGPVAVLVNLLPVSFVLDGIRHIGQGGGLETVSADLLSLSLWALLLLLAATRTFRWEEARRRKGLLP